jgi:hypothetical protein
MTPHIRKIALTTHIVCSVGWIGAVATFLLLAIAGLTSADAQLVRAAYLGMNLIGWAVIFPLSLASLLSGIIQALGTVRGLFRHYWVLIKLVITALASGLLLVHLQPVTKMAEMASESALGSGDMTEMRLQLVADAGAAMFALLVAAVLSVYKPRGVTRYGQARTERHQAAVRP